ncbi:MAG TPA: FkbM family methyltransferase [bacterium]|nr:FkbM family methyltransferase [bacterium]
MNRPKPDTGSSSPLLYLGVALIAFFHCLFLGQAYFDNDLLAQFGPWRAFLKDQLAQGHFPLWNPYHLGGQPFFADPQSMTLYPATWLTLPFSLTLGMTLFSAFHLFWGAWGTDLWLGALGLSRRSRRLGALTFALSGFFWIEIIHPPVIAAFAWLPWCFFLAERLTQEPKAPRAFWLGLVFTNLFLAGSPQVSLGAFYALVGYLLWRGWKARTRPNLRVLALLVWGLLPLLLQAIPGLEFISRCDRGTAGQAYEASTRYPLDPRTLYQFLLPRFGLPQGQAMAEALQVGSDPRDSGMIGNFGYLGIWAPFLAFWAFRRKGPAPALGLGLWAAAALLLSLGRYSPLHRVLCQLLPGVSYVHVPYRFLFLFVLPMAALVAFGFEGAFEDGKEGPRLSKPFFHSALVYGLVLYLAALWRPSPDRFELIALGSVLLGIFLAAWRPRITGWGRGLMALGLVAPLLLSGWDDFQPGPVSNFDFRENSKGIPEAAQELGPQRVVFFDTRTGYPIQVGGRPYLLAYPQNASCVLKVKNWGGYNPLVLRAKQDIIALPLRAQLQLGAIGGIFSRSRLAAIPGFAEERHGPYYFYRHQPPLPLAYAPDEVLYGRPPDKVLAAMRTPGFDAAQQAYVASGGDLFYAVKGSPAKLDCHLVTEDTDHQFFLLSLDKPNLVVFCEVMFPGWKAFVDGQPADIFTADHFLRALDLPAGKHSVEFRFEPKWAKPLFYGGMAWVLLTLIGFCFYLRRVLGMRNPFYALLQGIYYSIGGHGLGRIKVLRWTYDLLFGLFKPKKVAVLGHTLWLDDKDTLELGRRGVYEPFETELFQKEIKPGQTVVDVGANIGYYTLLAARRVGPQGRVYAFEPDPTNFGLLKKNVEENGYKNVVLVNKALSNKNGKTKLFLNPKNRGDHRVYDSGDGRESVTIGTLTLDSYLKKRKVDFIKMDIQGAEPLALAGMKRTIKAGKGLKLITEFSPDSIKLCGNDPKKFLATLQALGFKLSEISEKEKKLSPVTSAQLMKRDWKNGAYTNIFAIKRVI